VSTKDPPDLRGLFLHLTPAEVKLEPTQVLPHVWAAMMEWKLAKGLVSLVAIAEGSTSLYFSTGGGIIGGHSHESVRTANAKFLEAAERFLQAGAFVSRDNPLDAVDGAVNFVVRTFDGMSVARDTQKRIEKRESPLWPLYYLGHDVITALREVTEKKPAS
jgi:hypothetical protein